MLPERRTGPVFAIYKSPIDSNELARREHELKMQYEDEMNEFKSKIKRQLLDGADSVEGWLEKGKIDSAKRALAQLIRDIKRI